MCGHAEISLTYFKCSTSCPTKAEALGVPTPVTLSHSGPVVNEESVPKVNTSQRVEIGLWNKALMYFFVLPSGAASASGVSIAGGLGGLKIVPDTLKGELRSVTSVMAGACRV